MDPKIIEGETLVKTSASIEVADHSNDITREDMAQFSILRAVRSIVEGKPEIAKREREISAKIERKLGVAPRGVFMPLARDFTTADASGAGLVGTEHLASEFISVLRNKIVLGKVGVQFRAGFRGNVSIPKQTAAMNAYWVSEGVAPAASSPSVGQIHMQPHNLGCFTDITRDLMLQGTPDADAIVQADIYEALALGIQDAVLNGDGQNGKPLGVLNTPNVVPGAVAVSGSPTWPELCGFAGALDQWFVDGGNWVLNPSTFATLRGTKRFAASGADLTMGEIINGQKYLADEPAYTTGQMAAGKAIYGKWENVIVGMWGAVDIIVDPYSLSTAGTLRIVGMQAIDVAVRHPEAFVVTDDFPG